MHIIFGNVTSWQVFIIKLLKYLKFEVFYLSIYNKSEIKRNAIATNLKKNNIVPLPIEFEKEILPKPGNILAAGDPDEFSYKENVKLIPNKILKKYCKLFSIAENDVQKLRLLIQDIISIRHKQISGKLGIWSAIHPSKKIIYLSFKFLCFYNPVTSQNVYKLVIPLDIFNYIARIFKKIFSFILKFKNLGKMNIKNELLNKYNLEELSKKKVAFILHKGLTYGPLFEKTLFYSEDEKSCFYKYNILHLDYSDFPSPDQNISWVSLHKLKYSETKILLKIILASLKTFSLIRSWGTFLGWILLIFEYAKYEKYCERIKNFKSLKIAIIDYDLFCPKALIFALEKNHIKTVAVQERIITTFFTSFVNVILDTYYTASEFTADAVKKSKYFYVKNVIPIGQYRSDYITQYKEKEIPKEIFKAKENKKKILVILGYESATNWFDSYSEPMTNWTAQINFLDDCIKLSKNLKNTFIILRYKSLDWSHNTHFKNILKEINNCENLMISNNYEEFRYSYKLCANADLIIAKHTSLADECLAKGIPVIFHEYTHNTKKLVLDYPHYLPKDFICYNFEELLEKSKFLLFSNSSKLKDKINEHTQAIYHVGGNGKVKDKIIGQLENLIALT